jgi:hypothetical protein
MSWKSLSTGAKKRCDRLEHYLLLTYELKRLVWAAGARELQQKEAEHLTEVWAYDKP